mmetsp:Transcript_17232/g.38874  ORF Transcript_17232/g.38874 Transcript_17232/m.38874 type:complete len:175 (-) Transcript_17232:390-914(-)
MTEKGFIKKAPASEEANNEVEDAVENEVVLLERQNYSPPKNLRVGRPDRSGRKVDEKKKEFLKEQDRLRVHKPAMRRPGPPIPPIIPEEQARLVTMIARAEATKNVVRDSPVVVMGPAGVFAAACVALYVAVGMRVRRGKKGKGCLGCSFTDRRRAVFAIPIMIGGAYVIMMYV